MKNLDLKHRVAKWNLCYLMLKTISSIDNYVNVLVGKPLEVRDEIAALKEKKKPWWRFW